MPKRLRRPDDAADVNVTAFRVVREATECEPQERTKAPEPAPAPSTGDAPRPKSDAP